MSDSKVDLIFHPIRIRIVAELTGREMTVKDLASALPDVAQATLYRHINTLLEGGLVEIVEENPVRGTVERVYALREGSLNLAPEDFAGMSRPDYEEGFAMILASFMADAKRYMDYQERAGKEINPAADKVGLTKIQVHMSEEEYATMFQQFCAMLDGIMHNKPGSGRKRYSLGFLLFPLGE